MDRMKDDSTKPDHGRPDDQQAKEEGAERLRRQQLWLAGVLEGAPQQADAVKRWREGIGVYHSNPEEPAGEDESTSKEGQATLATEQLASIRRRIRERRVLAGKPSMLIQVEEAEIRFESVVEAIQADCSIGKEPSPLHLVLAARYIEGEIDKLEFKEALLDLSSTPPLDAGKEDTSTDTTATNRQFGVFTDGGPSNPAKT
jgi:hypothetical protein